MNDDDDIIIVTSTKKLKLSKMKDLDKTNNEDDGIEIIMNDKNNKNEKNILKSPYSFNSNMIVRANIKEDKEMKQESKIEDIKKNEKSNDKEVNKEKSKELNIKKEKMSKKDEAEKIQKAKEILKNIEEEVIKESKKDEKIIKENCIQENEENSLKDFNNFKGKNLISDDKNKRKEKEEEKKEKLERKTPTFSDFDDFGSSDFESSSGFDRGFSNLKCLSSKEINTENIKDLDAKNSDKLNAIITNTNNYNITNSSNIFGQNNSNIKNSKNENLGNAISANKNEINENRKAKETENTFKNEKQSEEIKRTEEKEDEIPKSVEKEHHAGKIKIILKNRQKEDFYFLDETENFKEIFSRINLGNRKIFYKNSVISKFSTPKILEMQKEGNNYLILKNPNSESFILKINVSAEKRLEGKFTENVCLSDVFEFLRNEGIFKNKLIFNGKIVSEEDFCELDDGFCVDAI